MLALALLAVAGCDEGVATERGHFLVDLGDVVMERAHESSPLAIAHGSRVCPEVVAQWSDAGFSSIGDPGCFTISGGGCWALETVGLEVLSVENTGGCASVSARDTLALDVVPWSEIHTEVQSVYDDAFGRVMSDENGDPLVLPVPVNDGVVTVLEGGRVLLRGVAHRDERFVAYDGENTRLTVGSAAPTSLGEVVVSELEAEAPLVLRTPDGPRTLGEVRTAPPDAIDSLEIVAGWVEDTDTERRYVYGMRVLARDDGGAVLHGAPVQWRVLEGDDVALVPSAEAPDFVEVSGGCDAHRSTPTFRSSTVQASVGNHRATANLRWRDAGSVGDSGAWRPDAACLRSENPPGSDLGCACATEGAPAGGWTLVGVVLAVLRRRRGRRSPQRRRRTNGNRANSPSSVQP